jgi:leader peptidase (prepilin peptidase)/N-methyltransferase
MYPLVEVATAITFVAAWRAFGPTPLLATRLIFLSALIVLAVTDLRERLLPNAITLPGIIVGLVCSLVAPPGPVSALLGVVIGGVVPFVVGEIYYRVRGVDGLGMGDVKMLAMIGAFLGWKLVLVTLVLSSFAGSLIGVAVIALKRGGLKYALPYGTFLALGALVASIAGDAIVNWYVSLY